MAKKKTRSLWSQGISTSNSKGKTVVTYTRKNSLPSNISVVKKGNTTVVTIKKKKSKKRTCKC